MSERRRNEKEEKEEEKRNEKDEKNRQEKSWDEKWGRDIVTALSWSAVFIWAGLVFLRSNLNLFPALKGWGDWSLIFFGSGIILLLQAFIRLLLPAYRRPLMGTIIFGLILLGVGAGLSGVIGWSIVWPIILIILGLLIVVRSIGGKRQ